MREASLFVGVIRREERASEVGMPAEALHPVGARLHGDGRIDCGLVQRLTVEARHAANDHGGVAQMLIGFRGFLLQCLQCGEGRGPCVEACVFEAVEAHNLNRVVVEGVVDVRKEKLSGVVIWLANFTCGVMVVGRDVECRVGATDGIIEGGGKETFEDFGVDVIEPCRTGGLVPGIREIKGAVLGRLPYYLVW